MIVKLSKTYLICRSLLTVLAAVVLSVAVWAQTPDNKPKDSNGQNGSAEEKTYNGYKVTFAGEFGYRWRSLDGNEQQYRSDLNYKKGFRTFDSSFFVRNDEGKGKFFDSLLVNNSGWGADPTGYTRINMEKIGFYKFNSTIRKINYYNNIGNYVAVPDASQHTQNTKNTMGDFDITILPQNEYFRLNLGTSFGNYTGPGNWTMRWNGDEFKVNSNTDNKSRDYRLGAEGKLFGFDWNFTQGYRFYKDRTKFAINAFSDGNNLASTSASVNTFSRRFPIDTKGYYSQFNVHRMFGDKLDFTGRVIYSGIKTSTALDETVVGRDASANFIDNDHYLASGNSRRPQTRADAGVTYNATNELRISNTFTFDQFSIGSDEGFWQTALRRTSTGGPLAPTYSTTAAWRNERFRRFTNMLEGDYQFTKWMSGHIGWRHTARKSTSDGYDASMNQVTTVWTYTSINTPAGPVTEENATNTLVVGMKIKPVKGWTVFWDAETGEADNVFTRLENYKFTNFRIRSKYVMNKFSFDLALITKNNTNPEFSYPAGAVIPTTPFTFNPVTDIKSRFFSGNVSWDPDSRFNLSGGFTYRNQNTFTPIIFPYSICLTVSCTGTGSTQTVYSPAYSQFFMHDRYGYVEAALTPVKRVSIYAAYRMNKDTGQDGLVSPLIVADLNPRQSAGGLPVYANVIGGYPMSFTTPEARVVLRLTHNLDWNVGYQYYKYNDVNNPTFNYRAHLPFTSLRFYFGGGTVNR